MGAGNYERKADKEDEEEDVRLASIDHTDPKPDLGAPNLGQVLRSLGLGVQKSLISKRSMERSIHFGRGLGLLLAMEQARRAHLA